MHHRPSVHKVWFNANVCQLLRCCSHMVGYARECQKNTCRRVDPVMNASAELAAKRPGFQRRSIQVSFPLRDPQCLVVLHILNKRKTKHEEYLNHLCPANETFNHCAVEFPPQHNCQRHLSLGTIFSAISKTHTAGNSALSSPFSPPQLLKAGLLSILPYFEKSSLTPPLKRGNSALPLITLTHAHTHKPLTDFFFIYFYSLPGLLLRQNYAAHFTFAKVCKENVKGLWLQLACKTTTRSGFYF